MSTEGKHEHCKFVIYSQIQEKKNPDKLRIKLSKSISPNANTEFTGISIWNILFSLCSLFSTHTQTDCPRYEHIHPMDLPDHSFQCNIEIVHLHLECGYNDCHRLQLVFDSGCLL